MHASTSQLAGSCSTLQQHKDPRTHHTLTQQRLAQHRAVSVASGARRLFVALRCFFVVLWLLFLLRCLHKLVPWANLSSMPTHTKNSSVSLPAQLVCAVVSATGGIVVELWGVYQCKRLPLLPRDVLHPARLLSYQYLAFAGTAVYSMMDSSVFVLPVHLGLSLIAMCCVFDALPMRMFIYDVVPYLCAGLAAMWVFKCKDQTCSAWAVSFSFLFFLVGGVLMPSCMMALSSRYIKRQQPPRPMSPASLLQLLQEQ